MSTALLAALALASLPAANPLSLPEGLASAPIPMTPVLTSLAAPLPTAAATPLPAPLAAPLPVPVIGESGSPSPLGLAGGGLIILCLGAATLWMNKRKRQGPRHIQVIETASLGPKRSLALVVVGRQSLLLSCSESGIFLVSSQPASAELLENTASAPAIEAPTPLFGRTPSPAAANAQGGFAIQLAEAEETQGLRRRLSEAGVLR